jgi:hypothetical protein
VSVGGRAGSAIAAVMAATAVSAAPAMRAGATAAVSIKQQQTRYFDRFMMVLPSDALMILARGSCLKGHIRKELLGHSANHLIIVTTA